jgi:hypothetical protein
MQTPKPLSVRRFNHSVDRRPACNKGLAKVAIQFSASTFVVKIATFAKPQTVG